MLIKAKRHALALLLCILCHPGTALSDNHILIIKSSDSSFKKQLSSAIHKNLEDSYKPVTSDINNLDDNSIADKDLVIAIGKDSVTILKKNTYRMAVMQALSVPGNNADNHKHSINQVRIHMDQPLCRQFRLIKALNPDWKTVGLLLSEKNDIRASALSACARKHSLSTYTVTVSDDIELITALNTALSNSDVLLSLPDPAIYNSRTIKNILLTSYRHRIPIIGFSENFVNAGAIAAVHTSAQQMASQVTQIVNDYFSNNRSFTRAEYYPSGFSVSINAQVAHSLEVPITESPKIETRLRQMESRNE